MPVKEPARDQCNALQRNQAPGHLHRDPRLKQDATASEQLRQEQLLAKASLDDCKLRGGEPGAGHTEKMLSTGP